jgi:hypothetical protein
MNNITMSFQDYRRRSIAEVLTKQNTIGIMQLLQLILLCLPFTLAHKPKRPCLTASTASALLTRFFTTWSTTDTSAIPSLAVDLVTSDFTFEDETINFGVGPCVAPPEGPLILNRDAFIALLKLRQADSLITEEKYDVLDTVVECEKIAVRWQASGKAIGYAIPNM